MATFKAQTDKLSEIFESLSPIYNELNDYATVYNRWFTAQKNYQDRKHIYRQGASGEFCTVCELEVWASGDGMRFVSLRSGESEKKNWNYVYHNILLKLKASKILESLPTELNQGTVPLVQMDVECNKEDVQGDTTQTSSKNSSTIITADQAVSKEVTDDNLSTALVKAASSEPTAKFPAATKRFMPVASFSLTDAMTTRTQVFRISLPATTYYQTPNAPNILPYRNFIYSRNTYKMRVIVNANKFQCGKLMVAILNNPYGLYNNLYNILQNAQYRKYALLDLAANNSIEIDVPFHYHRTFVRNVLGTTSNQGVQAAWNADVQFLVVSPLRTGAGGPTDLNVRMFYLLDDTEFAAISYNVIPAAQMDGLLSMADPLIKLLDKTQISVNGSLRINQDKPTLTGAMPVIPRARLGFPNGRGTIDATVLGNDASVMTNILPSHVYPEDPTSFDDLARIWGLWQTFQWSNTRNPNDVLFDVPINPTTLSDPPSFYSGTLSPLLYATQYFNYYSGPIELRFDFISNSFHTGSVLITVEFNRPTPTNLPNDSYACYTKTFHLGDQKSVSFVVPYIFDTVERRATLPPYNGLGYSGAATSNAVRDNALYVMPSFHTNVKVRVINELRPVSTVSSDIEILVWWRAAKGFEMRSLCQGSFAVTFPFANNSNLLQFPLQHGTVGANPTIDVPVTQMDIGYDLTGDGTNNTDPTQNFNESSPQRVQTLDKETNFKDILRRPVLLMSRVTVPAATSETNGNIGYIIPIAPPSLEYCVDRDGAAELLVTEYSQSLGFTPQTGILSMFRQWRGKTRFTFVVLTNTAVPIYITRIPKSGVRRYGAVNFGYNSTETVLPYGTGCPTEIFVPSVNPTITVECPYDSETDFLLMNTAARLPTLKWRDQGDYVGGHLAIMSTVQFQMDVWWSAGDDFTIANFIGAPMSFGNAFQKGWVDNTADAVNFRAYPRYNSVLTAGLPNDTIIRRRSRPRTTVVPVTQMDFKNLVGAIGNIAPRIALSQVPIVGPALAIAPTVQRVERVADSVNSLADKFGITVEALHDQIKPIIENLTKLSANLVAAQSVTSLIFNLVIDILTAVVSKSWVVVGLSLVRTLTNCIGTDCSLVLIDKAVAIGEAVKNFLLPTTQSNYETFDAWSFAGLIAAMVGTAFNVSIDPRVAQSSWWRALGLRLTQTSGITYFTQVINFFKKVVSGIYEYALYAVGYVSPEAEAIRIMKGKDNVIAKFVTESQILMTDLNSVAFTNPAFKRRYWLNVMQAMAIQRVMVNLPTSLISPVVSKMCTDFLKHANERSGILRGFPVKWEPFVICIEGPPGIGKSYLVEELSMRLLKALNFKKTIPSLIYYVNPSNDYWSGFEDQPIVCFDEWLNTNDPQSINKTIGTMYDLKSKKIFVPPQAELERKRDTCNAFAVIICTNDAFPDNIIKQSTRHPEAVYRRRDLVLQASSVLGSDGLRDKLSEKDSEAFSHLRFKKYKDAKNKNSLSTTELNFDDTVNYAEKLFLRYSAQEKVNVRKRVEALTSFVSSVDQQLIKLEDPFSLLYMAQEVVAEQGGQSTSMLPSELVNLEVSRLVDAFDTELARMQNRGEEIPTVGPDPFFLTDMPLVQSMTMFEAYLNVFFQPALGLIHWTTSAIRDWIRKQISYLKEEHECQVCLTSSKDIARVCRSSTNVYNENKNVSALHMVCRSCYAGLVMHSTSSVCCPACRDNVLFEVFPTELLVAFQGWYALYKKGVETIATFCDFIASNTQTIYQRVSIEAFLRCYQLAFNVIEPSLLVEVTFCSLRSGLMWMVASEYINYSPMVQSDWDSEEESIEAPALESDPFDPIENFQVLDDYLARPTVLRLCLHRELAKYAATVKFKSNHWHFVDSKTRNVVVFEEGRCMDCYWDDPEIRLGFYRSYLNLQRNNIRKNLINFYNSNSMDLDVPEVYWPSWVYIQRSVKLVSITEDNWLSILGQYVSNVATFLISWKGLVMSLGAIAVMYQFYGTTTVEAPLVQSNEERIRHFAPRPRSVPSQQRVAVNAPRRVDFQIDTTQRDNIFSKIQNNYVKITFTGVAEKKIIAYGVGIFGHTVIIPSHYKKQMQKGKDIVLSVCREGATHLFTNYIYSEQDFIPSETADISVFQVPVVFPMFADIRTYFMKTKDYKTGLPDSAFLLLPPNHARPGFQTIEVDISGYVHEMSYMEATGETHVALGTIQYGYSERGACGAILLHPNSTCPIMAMHFSGYGDKKAGTGFGVELTYETLLDIPACQSDIVDYDEPELVDLPKKILGPEIQLLYYGSFPLDQTPHVPAKSKIIPSTISTLVKYENSKAPAILSLKDPRAGHLGESPLWSGVLKHGIHTKALASDKLSLIFNAYVLNFLSQHKANKFHKLSIKRAIIGDPNVEFMEPVDLSTSVGYPWCLTQKKTKLEWCTDILRNNSLQIVDLEIDLSIIRETESKDYLRTKGIVPKTIFVDTLKDEKRSLKKVESVGGTRVFCTSPFDFTISMRQWLLPLFSKMMQNRIGNGFAVGIAPDGPQWTRLANHLMQVSGSNIVNLDYSNFGPGYNCQVGVKAWDVFATWLELHCEDFDAKLFKTMGYELSHSLHVSAGVVYRQFSGSPSGSPDTTPKNCLVNHFYIMLAWLVLSIEKKIMVTWDDYFENTRLVVYGDDLIMSVADAFSWFNMKSIIGTLNNIGIKATLPDKFATSIPEFVPLTEAEFLKRRFVPHPERSKEWLAPIDKNSIFSCLHWIWSCNNKKLATRDNCKAALELAYGHGVEFYNEIKEEINRCLLLRDIPPLLKTWDDLDNLFFP